jgi:hypothetical protein
MKGIEIRNKNEYQWARIGSADGQFIFIILSFSIFSVIVLTYFLFQSLPDSEWRIITLLLIYGVIGIVYINLGVWLHEQLHYLGFWGLYKKHHVTITYFRKYIFILGGHYSVLGPLPYKIMKRALLGPIVFIISCLILGYIGSLFLPVWWLLIFLTLAIIGLADMTTDIYWFTIIMNIGEKAKYWDKGRELHVVWKK